MAKLRFANRTLCGSRDVGTGNFGTTSYHYKHNRAADVGIGSTYLEHLVARRGPADQGKIRFRDAQRFGKHLLHIRRGLAAFGNCGDIDTDDPIAHHDVISRRLWCHTNRNFRPRHNQMI